MKRTPALALPECPALPTPGRAVTLGLVPRLHVGVSSNGRIPALQAGDAGSIPAVPTIFEAVQEAERGLWAAHLKAKDKAIRDLWGRSLAVRHRPVKAAQPGSTPGDLAGGVA